MVQKEMTLSEFEELAFAHGADLATWPSAAQGSAAALLDTAPEAKALLQEIAGLDAAIQSSRPTDPAPSADLLNRIFADAASAQPVEVIAAPVAAPETLSETSILSRLWQVFSPTAACAASAALGLWLGYAGPLDLTAVASSAFPIETVEEFALLDDVGVSPISGVIDLLETTE